MELNHLRHFHMVAKEGGFTAAARKLRIAQSAVSIAIRKLEADIGQPLFLRDGKTVRMTKVGNDLFRKCEIIFSHVDEIDAVLNGRQPDEVSGNVSFGAAEVIGTHLIPKVLHRLLKQHPSVYPHNTVGTASELVRLTQNRTLDFSLLFHAPTLSDELEITALIPVEYKLVVAGKMAKDHRVCSSFIGSREVDDLSVRTYPTLKKLQAVYPEAAIKISTNSLSAHKHLVEMGLGCAILPRFLVDSALKTRKLVCLLPREDFRFNLKVIGRRGEALSPTGKRMIELLSGVLAK